MKDDLQKFLKTGAPWEKMKTPFNSVFVVKVPGPKSDPQGLARLMIEINPVDSSGKPTKRKGLYIADKETYYQFLEALQEEGINKILQTIEEINPPKSAKQMKELKID